jgi:hypothetical protein
LLDKHFELVSLERSTLATYQGYADKHIAGRLGHGDGGTTTLRTYAAWVSESDQRAATSLFSRMPARPAAVVLPRLDAGDTRPPYERIASALRSAIEAGDIQAGSFLPSMKVIAEE